MNKILVILAVFTAMFIVVSCGGDEDGENETAEQSEQLPPTCERYGAYRCYNGDSYICDITVIDNELKWKLDGICFYGCDPSKGECKEEEIEEDKSFRECSSKGWAPCKDSSSGLIWSRKKSNLNWQDAYHYCPANTDGDYTDWRLPTIDELRTLIKNCPATETGGECEIITDCQYTSCFSEACAGCSSESGEEKYSKLGDTGIFWSSSKVVYKVHIVDFDEGRIFSVSNPLNEYYSLRCVRSE